jgi:probable phosphoglycerate mutase
MTRFFLIRHASTDAVGKRLAGRTAGVHLNEEGRAQAQRLAERLAASSISAIYSSPLERALETAAPLADVLGLQASISNDFIEIDFGEWTNYAIEDVMKDERFKHFNSFRSCTRIPGGETMLEAQARMIAGLEKLRLEHRGQTVAIVSHGDLVKAAVAYYAGIHLDLFQRIEIDPASVSIITVYDETARILQVNGEGMR